MWCEPERPAGRLRNIALTALPACFLSTLTGLGVFRLRTAAAVAEARDRQAVADLAAARDAAEQSSRAKSTFLAMMSHELRTPLNAIIGYGELMQEDLVARGDADMASDVGRMLTASRHLTAIIGDILDYSKLEAGRVALISTAVAPSALLVELVELMKPGATARGVALVLDAPAGIAPFAGDALRLRQVFLNLIGNAVKFTERGTVTVRLRQATRGPRRVIVACATPAPASRRNLPPVPAVLAGGQLRHPRRRRHRPGPRHQPPPRRDDARHPAGEEPCRPRLLLPGVAARPGRLTPAASAGLAAGRLKRPSMARMQHMAARRFSRPRVSCTLAG
jgi:hypothetical protein